MSRTRVYVSSTFEDLKDYRTKVNEGLRRAGHELVAMEDYPAFDQRPLQKCLADVASCQLYVGILAKRYGYVPDRDNPLRQSITEREYLQATASGLPRLVFQLDPKTPWQEQFDDRLQEDGDHGANIRRFREQVGKDHGNRFFATPDELARLVLEAVSAWEKEQERGSAAALAPAPRAEPASAPPYLVPTLGRDHDIVGRGEILEKLWAILARGENCSLIYLAGVGKTTVAVELVRQKARILDTFEGVLWADLGKRPEPLEQLHHWADALRVPAELRGNLASVEDWRKVVKAAIGQRRLLLVLDDAWSVKDAQDFAGLGSACVTLLTTRLPQVATDMWSQGEVLEVEELDDAQALELLEHIARKAVAADPESAREVVTAVQGLPLALMLMGRYLRHKSIGGDPDDIAEAFATLREAGLRLTVRRGEATEGEDERTLEEILDVSYEALGDEARAALEQLSIFRPKPHKFSKAMALDICGTQRAVLSQLRDMGLVEHAGGGAYTMHRVIAEYARTKLPRATAGELHGKALAWYRERLKETIEGDLSGYGSWYRYEKPAWQALKDAWLYHLAASGDAVGSVLAFLRVYFDAFWWWGYYQRFPFCELLIREWLRRDLGTTEREALRQLSIFQESYPAGYEKRGRQEDWRKVERALNALRKGQGLDGEVARIAGEDARRVRHFTDFFLAECAGYGRGERDLALARYDAAHDQFQDDGTAWIPAWLWFYVAQYLLDAGDPAAAADYTRRALAEAGEGAPLAKRDPELLANIHRQLGDLALAAGARDEALAAYRRAAFYAFIFQAIPEPADSYTVAFYREIAGRLAAQLTATQAAGQDVRGLATDLRDYWQPWWKEHPPPGPDFAAALATGDAAALEASLFPAVPTARKVIKEAAEFARQVKAVLPALRAAAEVAGEPPPKEP